ncbi:MAG: asparagine synthase (glutamine-hydrolyzing) [Raineya sp.]
MCGLHCIIDFTNNTSPESIKKMTKAAAHRGVSVNIYTQAKDCYKCYMGHNLLPISTQKPILQPFTDAKKQYFLLFNGEIYNWKQIDKKFDFQNVSQSDTETLFCYLVQVAKNAELWGYLEGIFAFVFLDTQSNQLLTGRDNWGVKPLYCYQDEEKILFSSEIKPFWLSGQVQKNIRKEAINEYLTFKFPLRPHTFFENISEHPNFLQIWDLQNKTKKPIHRPITVPNPKFEANTIINDTERLLIEAVKKQYSDFFPPALLLSGGLDSTLLLALAREQNLNLHAFSIATDQNTFTQDTDFAQKAAKTFQVPLEQVSMEASLLNQLPDILSTADYPIADTAILPTFLIAQKAKNHKFRVLWSGAGADELFAGYYRHQAYAFYLKNPKIWTFFANILQKIPLSNRQIAKFLNNIKPDAWQTFLNFASMEIKKMKLNNFENKSLLEMALRWDKDHYLFSDILRINDFWAMQATQEVRVPYLDETLTTFVEQIPVDFLLKKGRKWILKEILSKRGGKKFAQRPKQGFGVPFGHWIRNDKYHHHFNFLKEPHHFVWEFLDFHQINAIWHRHQHQKADYTSELFAIYFLAVWLERQ